jgi:hypothetical protein
MIGGISAEIRTRGLPNTEQLLYNLETVLRAGILYVEIKTGTDESQVK